MERDRALALLRNTHEFPGPYELRVVIHPHGRTTVLSLVAAVGSVSVHGVDEKASAQGRYVSLRIGLTVSDAEDVLAVYEVLRGHPHVVMAL
jgi:putative lipoic acid-binding regulatory protein